MTRKAEIERLLSAGRRLASSRALDVRWTESSGESPRVAIVVPKYGFTGVRRNTLKRRLRELSRLHLLPVRASRDVLLRARREAYGATFDALRTDIVAIAAALTKPTAGEPTS